MGEQSSCLVCNSPLPVSADHARSSVVCASCVESFEGRSPTPFYVYDEKRIRESMRRFLSIPYPNKAIHFATMANDNPRLLSMLRVEGLGAFINSVKHLAVVMDVGFPKEKVIFASTGIPLDTMRLLIKQGILVSIDSLGQLDLYASLAPGGRVGVRINIDEKSKNNIFIGAESRIGLMLSELPELFRMAAKHGMRLVGTHVYLGTDISLEDMLAGVEKTLEISDEFPDLEFVDVGGGFPIDAARFDFEAYKSVVTALFDAYSNRRGRSIGMVIEPGRALFGEAGRFYTTVTDVKERPDRFLVCCDASATLIPRAMFYEDYNPVEPADLTPRDVFEKPVDIVGATTYSRDFLSKGIRFSSVKVGDRLVFDRAGSYCYSMITRFLGQPLPPEYLKTVDGRIELIRVGESFLS